MGSSQAAGGTGRSADARVAGSASNGGTPRWTGSTHHFRLSARAASRPAWKRQVLPQGAAERRAVSAER